MRPRKNELFLFIPILFIMIISLGIMYHAKVISPLYQTHFQKQAMWFGLGFICVLILSKFRFNWLLDNSKYIYLFNILLLILVLFLGQNINGARAWFKLGPFSFQPSEFMKISLSLYLVSFLKNQKVNGFKNELLLIIKIFLIFLIPSILVFLEPDTGAIIFYALISFVVLLFSGIRKRWFLFFSIIILLAVFIFFYCFFFQQDFLIKIFGTSLFYRMDRLIHLSEGMQIENALIALGSMKVFDFNLTSASIYIPESPTDFAFTLAGSVFGIVGIVLLLICYFCLDLYFLCQIKKEHKKERKLFLSIFFTVFLFNQFYNILMNVGLIPIMGIPLPFLSYGGSTMIVYFIFLGLVLNNKKKSY